MTEQDPNERKCQYLSVVGCGAPAYMHPKPGQSPSFLGNAPRHRYLPRSAPPEPHEIVEAMVVTSWTCRACGAECDVWGEGAIGDWMECSTCQVESFLEMGPFDKATSAPPVTARADQ